MTAAAVKTGMTADAFLAWLPSQESSGIKYEFHDGEVYVAGEYNADPHAMAGASMRHNALQSAVVAAMSAGLADSGCRVFGSDQAISVDHDRRFVYPDASILCPPFTTRPGSDLIATRPRLIVEVLSAGTEKHDRGLKSRWYRALHGMEHYVLVSQSEPLVEIWSHSARMGVWTVIELNGGEIGLVLSHFEDSRVSLTKLVLDIDALYEGVFELPGDPLTSTRS